MVGSQAEFQKLLGVAEEARQQRDSRRVAELLDDFVNSPEAQLLLNQGLTGLF